MEPQTGGVSVADPAVSPAGVEELAALVRDSVLRGPAVVLSGAGLSTESGIPDYRGPRGSLRRHTPMTYQEFIGTEEARRRYWARSHVGWRLVARARPNAGHLAVTELQAAAVVAAVITQNVDGLHHEAGTRHVVELHGGLDRVRCLDCSARTPRQWLDRALTHANPDFEARRLRAGVQANPDGDVDLSAEVIDGFRLVPCPDCGGVLKPDVVFFGENVPKDRVARCFADVEQAGLLLVLGSSLTVMSGYRFVRRAAALDIPVAIVNQGPTRGDVEARLRVDAPLGRTLGELVERLVR